MQALGLIETRGLLAAIEAADAMVKSADVSIIEKTYVGGGLVTISITGDVGAVKASVEAGVAAVKKLDEGFLISEHVIPRPHEELKTIIGPSDPEDDIAADEKVEDNVLDTERAEVIEVKSEETETLEEKPVEEVKASETEAVEETKNSVENAEDSSEKNQDMSDSSNAYKIKLESLRKDDVDKLVRKNGIEKTIAILSKLRVVKLRNLAREYKDFVITGRTISKADKNLLIAKFKLYYEKK
ncbi:BMC domain-containing protein [Clostridium sp. PL3]|uniref:BMC domain-containing protein n=1 Tax=Clostridium thailandense TaxID=2794346 RepID=A0A949X4H3_9CLOT|nr:BMC domain-containing protein [Clostridium thailandense]MBV7273993.1 BMC domain-containing protein [Clostridium thailandense]